MAGNLNKVMLIGRLGRDPEVRYTKDGTAVANLRIATSDQWTDKGGERQERTEWHTVVLFARQAEVAGEYLSKGRLVFIEGRLETRKWQDQAGADRYSTEIRAQGFQMLDRGDRGDSASGSRGGDDGGSRGGDDGGSRGGNAGADGGRPAPRRSGGGSPSAGSAGSAHDDDMPPPPDDDDIPF